MRRLWWRKKLQRNRYHSGGCGGRGAVEVILKVVVVAVSVDLAITQVKLDITVRLIGII